MKVPRGGSLPLPPPPCLPPLPAHVPSSLSLPPSIPPSLSPSLPHSLPPSLPPPPPSLPPSPLTRHATFWTLLSPSHLFLLPSLRLSLRRRRLRHRARELIDRERGGGVWGSGGGKSAPRWISCARRRRGGGGSCGPLPPAAGGGGGGRRRRRFRRDARARRGAGGPAGGGRRRRSSRGGLPRGVEALRCPRRGRPTGETNGGGKDSTLGNACKSTGAKGKCAYPHPRRSLSLPLSLSHSLLLTHCRSTACPTTATPTWSST